MKKPVIRNLDIETAPMLAHVWRVFQEDISPDRLLEEGYIMSFSYIDEGSDDIYYFENNDGNEKWITKQLLKALDEADIVVGHNFDKFDRRWITGKIIEYGLTPPSPYRVVDTLKEARKQMYLPSYKLAAVAKKLGVAQKSSHPKYPGHKLWLACMQGNADAWDEMKAYNMQDVVVTSAVYKRLRPFMKNHPNVGVYLEREEAVCGRCGSNHIHWRGHFTTNSGIYDKFQCQECGGWGSKRTTSYDKQKRKVLSKNVG